MYALNFYSPMVADQLRSHRKTATIRLGDKSSKYKKGMVVSVLCGVRFGPREKVFDAVIDKVEVKDLRELSPREIEHDNPEMRRPEDLASFLSQLYNREITEDDTVTVIRFSQIVTPSRLIRRPRSSSGRRAVPQASHAVAKADANLALQEGQRARIGPAHCGHSTARSCSLSSK